MVRLLLSSTVLGVVLFAASANAAEDSPADADAGATVTIENGVQVIRGNSDTGPDCIATEDRPAQTININLTTYYAGLKSLNGYQSAAVTHTHLPRKACSRSL